MKPDYFTFWHNGNKLSEIAYRDWEEDKVFAKYLQLLPHVEGEVEVIQGFKTVTIEYLIENNL